LSQCEDNLYNIFMRRGEDPDMVIMYAHVHVHADVNTWREL